MKRYLTIIFTLLLAVTITAQETRNRTVTTPSDDDVLLSSPRFNGEPIDMSPDYTPGREMIADDSVALNLPVVDRMGQVNTIGRFPYGWAGWYDWQLHKGLNVNLGASVAAQFGRGAMSGVGFSQNVAMLYAVPLSSKLSLAVGGYLNNTNWGRYDYTEAGINAVLGYRFDEHWEAYLYAQKRLTENKFVPLPLYDMHSLGDRVGAAVRYNFNPSFSVQVSVESGNRPTYRGFHQHTPDYVVP